MKKPTSSDVARAAGVSQAAVSMILNGKRGVSFSAETRARGFDAARALGYNLPLQSAVDSDGRLLAVLVPTLSNPYYTQLLQAVEDQAAARGFRTLFCNTARDAQREAYYLALFRRSRVAGVIYTFLPAFPQQAEQLAQTIPTVLIGEKNTGQTLPSIELSNRKAGATIARHLLKLGHRRAAFLSTPTKNLTLARGQRLEGARACFEREGGELLTLFTDDVSEGDFDSEPYEFAAGELLARRLFTQTHGVTAVIGVNDMTALGVLSAARALGVRVPEDCSVCGFDNIFAARTAFPALTTVDHHLDLRGRAAVDIVLGERGALSPQVSRIEYEPRLIARSSTGPAPQ